MSRARVNLWGMEVGAVQWLEDKHCASFQYHDEFVVFAQAAGIELSPMCMPLQKGIPYTFAELDKKTFWGLPGLLADALPDRFGNDIINRYLAAQGVTEEDFTPVDRLCYVGDRAMGALSFEPNKNVAVAAGKIDIDALIQFGQNIINDEKVKVACYLNSPDAEQQQLLQITTSAGGAKAKALLDYNKATDEYLIGGEDSLACLIKFDAHGQEKRQEFLPLTQVEYGYYLQALHAGIDMQPSWLLKKHGAYHFVTQRFDRECEAGVEKKHFVQTLCGLFHWDYQRSSHSYENAMLHCRKHLHMGVDEVAEILRIAAFNVIYRNEDDHTKNLSLMMDKQGRHRLAPAYDLTYSHVPSGGFYQGGHCMSVNGKVAAITLDDLYACAKTAGIKKAQAKVIIEQVLESRKHWADSAEQAELTAVEAKMISSEIYRNFL